MKQSIRGFFIVVFGLAISTSAYSETDTLKLKGEKASFSLDNTNGKLIYVNNETGEMRTWPLQTSNNGTRWSIDHSLTILNIQLKTGGTVKFKDDPSQRDALIALMYATEAVVQGKDPFARELIKMTSQDAYFNAQTQTQLGSCKQASRVQMHRDFEMIKALIAN